MEAMTHGDGFILADGIGTETQSQGYDIDRVPLFAQFGQWKDQDTLVLDDGEGEGYEGVRQTPVRGSRRPTIERRRA
jgi:hypothetical protein